MSQLDKHVRTSLFKLTQQLHERNAVHNPLNCRFTVKEFVSPQVMIFLIHFLVISSLVFFLMAGAGYLWLGGGERGLMHLVPAPAVKLMKSRVLSRPGVKKVEVRKKD